MATAYSASKYAPERFTEALSYELASQHITAKMVPPFSGVLDVAFAGRSRQEMPLETPLKEYNNSVAHTNALFGNLIASGANTSAHVAEVIFGAVTDGTSQHRYLVSRDDTRPFIEARKGMSDQDYIEFTREVARGGDAHKNGIDFIK